MWRGFRFPGPFALLIGLVVASMASAEVNTHIPYASDPATSATFSPRDYDILIGPAVKIHVRIPIVLQNACRSGSRVVACTFFAEENLTCRCQQAGEQWQLQASVNFVPVMYLSYPQLEKHEQSHVDDVTGMLRDHLESLVDLRFNSEQDCSLLAEDQKRGFTGLMNEFRRQSNLRLH